MKLVLKYIEQLNSRKTILIAFVVCLIPRVVLALLNKAANDDHIEPIMLWMQNGFYPETRDCWECFQPPFYYGIVKTVAELLKISTRDGLREIFHALNFIFAFICLVLIFLFQFKCTLPFIWNLSLALFWGLNPKLIGIGVQATNDIPVIALGMLFTTLSVAWIEQKKKILFALIIITIFFATIIKGNGLVLFIVFSFVLAFDFLINQTISRMRIALNGTLLIITFPLIAYLGNYYHKYKKHNNPFMTNMDMSPAPNWFVEDTIYEGRKGVTTIADTYFTFRLFDLLKNPYVVNETKADYALNRTSFFTQLYGQFSNVLFERWPWDWLCKNNDMLNFSRANYIFQLPLLLFFLMGIWISIKHILKEWDRSIALHLILFFIYLFFAIKYSYDIRDYGNMKIIFLFPALLSMMYFLQTGIQQFRSNKLNLIAFGILNISTILYIVNLVYLYITLHKHL